MSSKEIKITDIYNKFAFEWAFNNDSVRWQTPAHLLLGETSLYESGDHLANRLTAENYKKRLSEIYKAVSERKPYSVTYEMQVQTNKVATIHEEGRIFFNPEGEMLLCRGYIWSKDVREQSLNEYFSNSDAITYLTKILDETEAEDLNASFVYLCIDRLPILTIEHGLKASDQVMKLVQKALVKATREYDVVGNISGTSFGIVLQNCGHNEIISIAKRLNEMLENTGFEIDGEKIALSASIGGCVVQQSKNTSIANILNHSERALLDAQHLKKISIPTKYLDKHLNKSGNKKEVKRRQEDMEDVKKQKTSG